MSDTPLFQSVTFEATMPGPHLLITGGIHGDEFEPMIAIRQLCATFRNTPDKSPLLKGRLTFIPVVNEAAFLRGHRTAEDGLDLARTFPGRPDGSLTERVAAALTPLIQSADFYIDLHTGGTELAVLPLAGYVLHSDPEVLEKQRQMARAFNLPVIWGTGAGLEGRTLSVARDANVPAIYTEYLGSATWSPAGVAAYVEGCRNVMGMLGMLDVRQPESHVKHEVEDNRPQSGHMQVCNPAPMTGSFESFVRLGDRVEVGTPLGIISDPLGTRTETVLAKESGIVITLRTFPRVKAGDSVGVVLEL